MTLVELLVVISIIAVLMGLLLPAVQSVREGSSQVQCRNNLKQLGLGLLSYETSRGAFPPGCVYSGAVASQANMMYANWAILILPHLEQLQLFNQYDQSTYNMAPGNLPVLQTVLGVMTGSLPSAPSGTAESSQRLSSFSHNRYHRCRSGRDRRRLRRARPEKPERPKRRGHTKTVRAPHIVVGGVGNRDGSLQGHLGRPQWNRLSGLLRLRA